MKDKLVIRVFDGATSNYVPDITNDVNNVCLKAMVQTAIDQNIVYQASKSMKSIFGAGSKFNLQFKDGPIADVNGQIIDAQTDVIGQPTYQMIGNRKIYASMNLKITLNSTALANASSQYITVTILHEALHAYFKQTGQIDDHDEMVNNYVPWFEDALKATYPQMSAADVEALTYGGLMDSAAFSQSDKQTFRTVYGIINNDYATGVKGSPCGTH